MAAIFLLLVWIVVWITPSVSGLGVRQPCDPTNDQYDAGMVCSNGTSSSEYTCRRLFGEPCTYNHECLPSLSCSRRPGSQKKCRISAGSDVGCSNNDSCESGAGCISGFCWRLLGEACSTLSECLPIWPCEFRPASPYKCRIPVGSNESCTDDLICAWPAKCFSGFCKRKYGSSCDMDNECQTMQNQKCIADTNETNHCLCESGYFKESNGGCLKEREYSSLCDMDIECQTVQNQKCIADTNGTERCLCESGYFKESNGGCLKENLMFAENLFWGQWTGVSGSRQEKSISLTWQKPIGLDGNVFDYKVVLSSGQTNHSSNWTSELNHTFSGLTPGSRYSATVYSRTPSNPGYGNVSAEWERNGGSFYTKPAKPGNLTMSEYPGPDVTLLFYKSEGHVDQYRAKIVNAYSPVIINVNSLDLTFSATFKGLNEGEYYNVSIEAVLFRPSSSILLSERNVQQFRVKPNSSDEVSDLSVPDIGSRSAEVIWKRPQKTGGVMTGYEVLAIDQSQQTCVSAVMFVCTDCAKPMTDEQPTACTKVKDETTTQSDLSSADVVFSANLTGLLPDVTYTFQVVPYNEEGYGHVDEQSNTTHQEPAEPLQGPVGLEPGGKGQLNVSWTPGTRTGPTNYTITWAEETSIGSGTYSPLDQTIIQGYNTQSYVISDLLSYWNYKVSVQVSAPLGSSDQVYQVGLTASSAPEALKSVNITQRDTAQSVEVRLVCPDERKRKGRITKFTYTSVVTAGDQQQTPPQGNIDVDPDVCSITHNIPVTAETGYNFTFRAVNYEGQQGIPTSQMVTVVAKVPMLGKPVGGPDFMKMSETSPATSKSVTVEMCSCLLDSKEGKITDVGLIICNKATDCKPAGRGSKSKDFYDQLMPWKQFKEANYGGVYRPSVKHLLNKFKQASGRRRRSVSSRRVARAAHSYLPYVIGENQTCETAAATEYCNGPLPPDREFIVIVWACTAGGCSEAQDPLVIRTAGISDNNESVNTGVIVGGVLAFLAVIVIIIILVVIVYRRRHRPKNSSSLSTNQQPVHQVEHILHDQKSMNLILYPARVELLHRNSNHYFKQEYQELLCEENEFNYTSDVGKLDINRVKNRYAEMCPYDHTRVKLYSQDDLGQDYINASYIAGLQSPCDYLATQGPMASTIPDFWKMVLDHHSPVIVMLSGSTGYGLSKVDQYWPRTLGVSVRYGKVNVTMTSMATLPKYMLRNFSVCTNEHDVLKVSHFQLMGWEVQGSTFSLEEVADTLYDVGERSSSPAGPVTVHCSDGTARTGSFIALDLLRTYVTQHALGEEVDVFHILLNIIKCRPRMVQSERQYMFIHDVLRVMVERKMRDEQGRRELYQNVGIRDSSVYDTTYSYVPEGSVYDIIGNKTPSATTGM